MSELKIRTCGECGDFIKPTDRYINLGKCINVKAIKDVYCRHGRFEFNKACEQFNKKGKGNDTRE